MKKVLIFSGTTEGRKLSVILAAAGIFCDVCVATEYGEHVMEEHENIRISCKRLSASDMRQLYSENDYYVVVDSTHPYAKEVTSTIKESLDGQDIPYIRLLRKENGLHNVTCEYESVADCAKALKDTSGNILITTGSKELHEFTRYDDLRRRIIARVIPSEESLRICYENGLKGCQIIAMQGPFSKDMNKAIINQNNIKHLVTKLSGRAGGETEKLDAAFETGICTHVIRRPKESENDGCSINQVIRKIESLTGCVVSKPKIEVNLLGIGCGSKATMTMEAAECINKSDYIFGAERMLSVAGEKAVTFPYYLADDIIPEIERIYEESFEPCVVSVLFSGDTGFYSGCSKLSKKLDKIEYINLKVYPGISSIQALSAAIHISWDDAEIISAHGREDKSYLNRIIDSSVHNKKTFFIMSGAMDVSYLGAELSKRDNLDNVKIYIGYNMSYEDELVRCIRPEEMTKVTDKGLYVGAIINDKPQNKVLTPILRDDDFIRDRVPMTKENIRKLSICHLNLSGDSIVYDIGCGSGSVAIDIALLSPSIHVYAIECNENAIELTKRNIAKHNVSNITVVNSTAPEGLGSLPIATHAFIGGSKGNLKGILDELRTINSNMRVVMNAVSIESIAQMNELLKTYPVSDVDVISVSVSSLKKLGSYSMPDTGNQVYIFSFNLKDDV